MIGGFFDRPIVSGVVAEADVAGGFAGVMRRVSQFVGSEEELEMGPDASADSSPIGTSLIPKVSFVERGAAAARRPPLVAERCFRTALISSMGAPQVTSAACSA